MTHALILAVAVFALADLYLTAGILKAGGRELNPAMRQLIVRFGLWPSGLATKVLGAAVAAFASTRLAGTPDYGLAAAALASAAACAWNWPHWRKSRR